MCNQVRSLRCGLRCFICECAFLILTYIVVLDPIVLHLRQIQGKTARRAKPENTHDTTCILVGVFLYFHVKYFIQIHRKMDTWLVQSAFFVSYESQS